VLGSPFLGAENAASFKGGVGAVMLVHYEKADCGPYDELLYIPGFFEHNGKNYMRITKIYVSTKESVEWGRRNWAIQKLESKLKLLQRKLQNSALQRL
jgi:hypothetical protein